MARVFGSPCRNCGSTERYARTNGKPGGCVACCLRRSRAEFNADPEGWKAKRRRAYHETGKLDRRQRNLKEKYGLTLADFDSMLRAQDCRCAICGTNEPGGSGNRFHVDHNHETGQVRALLCHQCNKGVGNFRDNPEMMERAAEYVRRFG